MPVLKNFDLILLLKSPVLFFIHLVGVTTDTEKDYLFILKVLIKYLLSIYLHRACLPLIGQIKSHAKPRINIGRDCTKP